MSNTISPEDMASFEVLHTQNHHSDSLSSGEYSFLPDVTHGPVPNGDINHHINDTFDLTNMQSALGSTMPSTAEVHSQLLEIIAENNSLKDKLNKNNAMMKDQMVTISAWREHMITAKEQQEQVLKKAKEKICALEKENTDLIEQLKETTNVKQEQKAQSCEKCTIFDTALNNMLALDSFENNESILLEFSYFRENLLSNLMKLCSLLESLSASNISGEAKQILKTFVLLLKFKVAALEGGNSSATVKTDEETGYEVVHKKSHENNLQLHLDIEGLKKALNGKNTELAYLKKENEELCEKIKAYELKIQECEMALKTKFELMNNKLDLETSLSEKYKERCENLQQQLEEYQVRLDKARMSDDDVVKELREDVRNLQDILKLEQESNQNDRDKLAQVMLKCEKLQVDFDRVSKLLELESGKVNELTTLKEVEKKEYLSKIDELTAQFFEMEEQKRECEEKIRILENKLAETEEQTNDVALYKQQIDTYEKDFENIREANNKAVEEIEQLKNELKQYEKKCDSCPCPCKSHPSLTRTTRGLKPSPENQDQNVEKYECPFCHAQFAREREINHHIYRCHKEDDAV